MGNRLSKPRPHIYDNQFSKEIDAIASLGYGEAHYYTGSGKFRLATDTHLIRCAGCEWVHDEPKYPDQKWNYFRRIEYYEVFKRKSRPFLPIHTFTVAYEYKDRRRQ